MESELIRIKKTKFVEMNWNPHRKGLYVWFTNKYPKEIVVVEGGFIPINKIPSVMRGLLTCYQRFYRKERIGTLQRVILRLREQILKLRARIKKLKKK